MDISPNVVSLVFLVSALLSQLESGFTLTKESAYVIAAALGQGASTPSEELLKLLPQLVKALHSTRNRRGKLSQENVSDLAEAISHVQHVRMDYRNVRSILAPLLEKPYLKAVAFFLSGVRVTSDSVPVFDSVKYNKFKKIQKAPFLPSFRTDRPPPVVQQSADVAKLRQHIKALEAKLEQKNSSARTGVGRVLQFVEGRCTEYAARNEELQKEVQNLQNEVQDLQKEVQVLQKERESAFFMQRLEDAKCCICFERTTERNTFVPCGHMICCSGCTEYLTLCPLCRKQIEQTITVYG